MADPILSEEEQPPLDGGNILDRIEDDGEGGLLIHPEPLAEEVDGPDESEFYDDLSEAMPEHLRMALATELLQQIDYDKQARQEREKQYAEGIRKTGMVETGGAAFTGGSTVVHPVMAECCVDFASRMIRELLPQSGPVKYKLKGQPSPAKVAKARRKTDYMNWQLTEESMSFRPEMEKMLTQVPLGGSQYIKIWWDPYGGHYDFEFVPIDKTFLPFSARGFYAATRLTVQEDITTDEFESRMASGQYRTIDNVMAPSSDPDQSDAEQKSDKVEGKAPTGMNEDGMRTVYWVRYDGRMPDGYDDPLATEKGRTYPYVISIDETSREIVEIRRNWMIDDKKAARIDWIHEFSFIPWRGAYAIGMPHLIGGLATAMTGALRALLDSAHVNNFPTVLKLKSSQSGTTTRLTATGVHEIESEGVDDIRKMLMPVPFNPPSDMLFRLLGWLDEATKGVIRMSLEDMAAQQTNVPVGTQLSRVEQGMVVFSAIFARLHYSMGRLLRTMHDLNGMYIDEQVEFGDEDEQSGMPVVMREDYAGRCEMVPVSDPLIFSEQQRMAQMQAVHAIDQMMPGVLDQREMIRRDLDLLRIPDPESLLKKQPTPKMTNQAAENVAMVMGQPVAAFPGQDHVAHMQVILNFIEDPLFGGNPIMQQSYMPAAVQHIKEHLALWYVESLDKIAKQEMGFDPSQIVDPTDPQMVQQLDGLLAAISNNFHNYSENILGGIMPTVLKAAELAQKISDAQRDSMIDPMVKVAEKDVERKGVQDQQAAQHKSMQLQLNAHNSERSDTIKAIGDKRKDDITVQTTAQKMAADKKIADDANDVAIITTQMDNASRERIADEKNETAVDVAAMRPKPSPTTH